MPSRRRAAMNSWSLRRGRIEHHAFGAILAADARPQGVVAIERDGLELGRGDGVNLARHGSGQGHEIERRIGYASQFVAVRIVDFRHRIQGGDLGGSKQVDGGQVRDTAPDLVVQLDGAGTQNEDQRNRRTSGGGAYGIDEFSGLCGAPIVEADQRRR